jgi:hypothetical protein
MFLLMNDPTEVPWHRTDPLRTAVDPPLLSLERTFQ